MFRNDVLLDVTISRNNTIGVGHGHKPGRKIPPPRMVGSLAPEMARHQEERRRHPLRFGSVGAMEEEQ